MSPADWLVMAFYGSLAGAALFATARDRELVWVGVWLVINCFLSNVLYLSETPLGLTVGVYTLFESMVALAAFVAWGKHRSRLLIALVAFAGLSVVANVGIASFASPAPRQVWLWAVTTNICFGVECLLAFVVGVAHGYRTGRFHWRPDLHWRSAQPDGARAKADER